MRDDIGFDAEALVASVPLAFEGLIEGSSNLSCRCWMFTPADQRPLSPSTSVKLTFRFLFLGDSSLSSEDELLS